VRKLATWNVAANAGEATPDVVEGLITLRVDQVLRMAKWDDADEQHVALVFGKPGESARLIVVPESCVVAVTGWRE
jgi:hypothetical protein